MIETQQSAERMSQANFGQSFRIDDDTPTITRAKNSSVVDFPQGIKTQNVIGGISNNNSPVKLKLWNHMGKNFIKRYRKDEEENSQNIDIDHSYKLQSKTKTSRRFELPKIRASVDESVRTT